MISSVVVSYMVRPEAVAEHVRLIEAVFEQLRSEKPTNVEYKVMRLADGVLLVTRPGKTSKRQLQRALEAVEQPKLLGAVINGSNAATLGDYYQYYAGHISVPEAAGHPA